jgi:hypothetical protein
MIAAAVVLVLYFIAGIALAVRDPESWATSIFLGFLTFVALVLITLLL